MSRPLPAPPLCAALLGLLLCSCGTVGTIKSSLYTEELQRQNEPAREVRVVVLTPDGTSLPAIRELLGETSRALSEQVGITLVESDVLLIEHLSGNYDEMLQQVAGHMESYEKAYDLAVAFQRFTFLQFLQYVLIGTWEGMIDDPYRRFIVVRRMTSEVLLHELCHAFIFSRVHSWGLMSAYSVYLVPGVVSLNRSPYLVAADRKEILAHKWRDFSLAPRHLSYPVRLLTRRAKYVSYPP